MKKNNNLVPIYSQYPLDNLPTDPLKRIHVKKKSTPVVNKAHLQITPVGVFLGYESGNYETQEIEMEFYKD